MTTGRDAADASIDEAADAALIDRLYGEGAPGSPADVDDLDGLRSLRGLIARVRDEAPVAEPSQALSARLLLAAAEHAPRRPGAAAVEPEGPGLWARVRTWFAPMFAHPGLAAAATLVVVVGVGGALYLRGKGAAHEPTLRRANEPATAASADPTQKDQQAALPGATGAFGGDGDGAAPGTGSGRGTAAVAVDEESPSPDTAATATGRRDPAPAAAKPEVGFQDDRGGKGKGAATVDTAKAGKVSGGATGGGGMGQQPTDGIASEDPPRPAPKAPPPPPPSPPPSEDVVEKKVDPHEGRAPIVVTKEPVQERKPAPTKKAAEPSPDPSPGPSPAERARDLATRAVTAAKAGRCPEMEQLAGQVRELDAAYHDAVLVKQADVVKCRAKQTPRKK